MFQDLVFARASALLFIRGRLTFLYPDGNTPSANSGAASVLVAYGAEATMRLERSGIAGKIVYLEGGAR